MSKRVYSRLHYSNTPIKHCPPPDMLIVRSVCNGGWEAEARLTAKELHEVIRILLSRGMYGTEIAQYLGCSLQTVYRHKRRIQNG